MHRASLFPYHGSFASAGCHGPPAWSPSRLGLFCKQINKQTTLRAFCVHLPIQRCLTSGVFLWQAASLSHHRAALQRRTRPRNASAPRQVRPPVPAQQSWGQPTFRCSGRGVQQQEPSRQRRHQQQHQQHLVPQAAPVLWCHGVLPHGQLKPDTAFGPSTVWAVAAAAPSGV